MVATNHAREQTHYVEMALKNDGTVLGLKDTIYANLGDAYPWAAIASLSPPRCTCPGMYKIQNYHCELIGVVTNKTPFGAHRGFGKSEASFVIERMMDIAAAAPGARPGGDPLPQLHPARGIPVRCVTRLALRQRQLPRRAAACAGAGRLRRHARAAAAEAGARRAVRDRHVPGHRAVVVDAHGLVQLGLLQRDDPYGPDPARCHVASGGNDEGQGHWTTGAQLRGRGQVGWRPSRCSVREGDSLHTPYGSGSYSSRFSVVGTSGVTMAARTLAAKIRRIAAHLLEMAPDDLELADGRGPRSGATRARGLALPRSRRSSLHPRPRPAARATNRAWS